MLVHIQAKPGIGRRELMKDLKLLRKGVVINPLDIEVWSEEMGYLYRTNKDLLDYLLEEGGNHQIIAISSDDYDDLMHEVTDTHYRRGPWVQGESFMFARYAGYGNIAEGNNQIRQILTAAWYTVQQRRGALPSNCPNCEEEYAVSDEETCMHCEIDLDVPNFPEKLHKIYEVVAQYEEESGKQVLERVA